MQLLTRMTCEYQPLEDRIRITGEVSDEKQSQTSSHTLWLTQRLALRLIPTLVNVIEHSEHVQSSALPESQQKALHSLKQEWVSQQVKAESAVAADDNGPNWLISHVDLSQRDQQLILTIRNDDHQLQLALNGVSLRQWLNILLRCFQQGEWPLDCWPTWMREPDKIQSKSTQAIH